MNRIRIVCAAAAAAGALLLSGCTDDQPRDDGPSAGATQSANVDSSGSAEPAASGDPRLSGFEQQLPLRGDFVSQQTETTGSVLIERRPDGTTWAMVSGFSTGDASDLRLVLKEGALDQNSSGFWVDTAGYSFDIAPLDPDQPDQEIAIPGAHTMPAIDTLTVMNDVSPDSPSFGSVALTG